MSAESVSNQTQTKPVFGDGRYVLGWCVKRVSSNDWRALNHVYSVSSGGELSGVRNVAGV